MILGVARATGKVKIDGSPVLPAISANKFIRLVLIFTEIIADREFGVDSGESPTSQRERERERERNLGMKDSASFTRKSNLSRAYGYLFCTHAPTIHPYLTYGGHRSALTTLIIR